jgi:ATP-binding cassette, subfamily B, bacterial
MTFQTLKLFLRATWRYKWLAIFSEVGTIFFWLADYAIPIVTALAIDKLTGPDTAHLQFSDFYGLLGLFIASRLVKIIAGRVMMQAYNRYEPNVVRDLEILSFQKLQGHSMAFFADNFSGALVAKVNRLTTAYKRTAEVVLGDLLSLTYRFLFTLGILLFLNPLIAGIFLVWAIPFVITVVWMHKRKMHLSKAASNAQTRVTARLADIITNTLTIRSFARVKQEEKAFTDLSQERRDLRFRSYQVSDRIRLYKATSTGVINILILALSIHFGISGELSIGGIFLIQMYLFQLIDQLWNFGRIMDGFEEAMADAAEMTEIIMQPHGVVDPPHPEKSRLHDGAITFSSVSFRYQDAAEHEQLFQNLQLTIPAGQKVGLVGPSGGGKTTLTKLLLRFMDINSGEIMIDGQNIANIRQDDLRQAIAYVPQEPLLFHRSIYDNIAYGDPGATKKDVYTAAKRANASEFIDVLPKKYDTIVGERGVKLSGGQRQRVAIARAMLKPAPILVLDEATSSLDSMSEKYITDALDDLMAKRTTIVVAHRLSTIRKMDRILVVDDGKILEDGSHDELIKKHGLYAALWSHQSGDYIVN